MRRRLAPGEKPLFWIGSSKRDCSQCRIPWFVRSALL
jgi:hypothetical protein